MKRALVGCVVALVAVVVRAETEKKEMPSQFYIYDDKPSPKNHFVPSGYMGDFGDIKQNERWNVNPATGKTCIKVDYSAKKSQGAGWAGVYWQTPPNNWANLRGGINLTGYTKLKVKLRGAKGGERLDKIGLGGIPSAVQDGDSDNVELDDLELTKDWREYTVDLSYNGKPLDLSHIIGGFLWAANADNNPDGMTFFIDDLRLEK